MRTRRFAEPEAGPFDKLSVNRWGRREIVSIDLLSRRPQDGVPKDPSARVLRDVAALRTATAQNERFGALIHARSRASEQLRSTGR